MSLIVQHASGARMHAISTLAHLIAVPGAVASAAVESATPMRLTSGFPAICRANARPTAPSPRIATRAGGIRLDQ